MRVVVAVAGPLIAAELVVAAADLVGFGALAVRITAWVCAGLLVTMTVTRPLLAELAVARMALADREGELGRLVTQNAFRERVERALEQATGESSAIRAALRATHELCPDADVTLLLAVPEEPRVGWTVRLVDGEVQPARPIPGTPGCAALAGNTIVAATSSDLDACAHLQDPDMAVSAACVPLQLGERVLGVLSTVEAPGEGPDHETLEVLEWVAERTGSRIAELRRLSNRRNDFRSDPVTGLPGSDALDSHLRDSLRSLVPFCVALVEIDDFEGHEHLWSHEATSASLRTLAEALRLTLRPDDIVCRLDHGRFAVVLENCGATHASLALERVRESLALTLSISEASPFTFSAGVVESHRATSIADLTRQAGTAMHLAHRNGGNRVALATG